MRTRSSKAFTLTELMVTMGIIGVVASVSMTAVTKATVSYRAAQCVSNQRQISHALQLFYTDHRTFPSDVEGCSLQDSLAGYLDSAALFKCPSDPDPDAADSYQPYYVRRPTADGGAVFTLGCPRHQNAKKAASLFHDGSAELLTLGGVTANGDPIKQNLPADQRTISSGNMGFEDQSTVNVTSAQAGYGVTLVQSVRLGDGTLYTIVRVKGDGQIDVTVTPGSKFEVVTPSAIVGVRGTVFTVTTSNSGTVTAATVSQGRVWVQDRVRGRTIELAGSQTTSIEDTAVECMHCAKHCRTSKHCNHCSLGKNKDKDKDKDKERRLKTRIRRGG